MSNSYAINKGNIRKFVAFKHSYWLLDTALVLLGDSALDMRNECSWSFAR